MADYLRVQDGIAVERWTAPEGSTPADCFTPDLAATFRPADAAQVGWLWDASQNAGAGAFTPPPPPSVGAAELIAYAAAKRFAVEAGGITVGGAKIATDRDSQAMIGNAFAYVTASGAASVRFKAASGWVTLTADQVKALALAVGAHVQAAFAVEDDLDAAINASPPTVTTTAQIDAAPWPANA